MSDLSDHRKKKLNSLASEIVSLFDFEKVVDPEIIASENNLSYYYDNYGIEKDGSGFEGLQIYDGQEFHTHINLDLVGKKDSNRARFAFAHELGHYFIEEHHKELKKGYHPSRFDPKETNIIELEANYFAGALLMPDLVFKDACSAKKFNLDLVHELSGTFHVSDLATILRYIGLQVRPLMMAYVRNGILEWFNRTEDFPFRIFKTKVGKPVPQTSVVGEYFRLGKNAKYTDVEVIFVDDWFVAYGKEEQKLNEQCFYSDYGYVISLIWPE